MTISRSSSRLAALFGAIALAACQGPARTIAEIVVSDLRGDALVETFTDRILALSDSKAALTRELAAAGFRAGPDSNPPCERWAYAAAPDDANALRAFVDFCDDRGGGARLRRLQIHHGPLGTPT